MVDASSLGSLVLPTSLLLQILAIANPLDNRIKVTATAASLYSLYLAVQYPPSGSFMSVWPLGMNIYGQAQRCFNHMWLRDPAELARSKKIAETKKKDDTAVGLSFVDAAEAATTFRGPGWRFGLKNLPTHSSTSGSRIKFAASRILGGFLRFLVLDLAITTANTSLTTLTDISIPLRLALGAIMLLYVRWTMDIPYRILSAICVLSGFYQADDWPPLFGRWSEAYTVRRFWSRTWHQCMRLVAEPPVNFVINNIFAFEKGSYLTYWASIFGSFTMAFFDHAYGRVVAGGDPMRDWIMFTAQPVAIFVEETVRDIAVACGLVHRQRRSGLEMALGYVWVTVFECWTFLDFMDGAIRLYGDVPAESLIEPAFGVSIVKPLLEWYFA